MLYRRGHKVDICFAAGLGKLDLVHGYLWTATAGAAAWAGWKEIARLLA